MTTDEAFAAINSAFKGCEPHPGKALAAEIEWLRCVLTRVKHEAEYADEIGDMIDDALSH